MYIHRLNVYVYPVSYEFCHPTITFAKFGPTKRLALIGNTLLTVGQADNSSEIKCIKITRKKTENIIFNSIPRMPANLKLLPVYA